MPIVGDVLADRYRIESVLGVGGMASVYLATDLRLDREVAVKVLVANLAADAQFAERFNSEAGAMASFNHPNVAAVYDVEPGDPATGREPFYVMEYCEGGSLADRLKGGGRIPPAELVPIITAIAEGLAELHSRGLVHRDVKPANILFAGDRPKLADFGVARNEEPRDGEPLTLPGSTIGTVQYLAPELATGAPPSAASDVYALGVTIFQALTGRYPQSSTVAETNADRPPGAPTPVSVAAPDLGRAFDAPLARALDADPIARPSPTELTGQLAAGLGISGVASPNPRALAGPNPRPDAASRVDMDAPTLVATVKPVQPAARLAEAVGPQPAPQRQPVLPRQPAVRQPALTRSGRIGWGPLAIILTALAIVAVIVVPRLQGGAGLPGASAAASARASAAPSATALPSGNATVLAALNRVDAAVDAARGGKDGLNGRDANELAQLAASVRTAVDRGDLGAALAATGTLSDRARKLSSGLDKPRREALLTAIDRLSAALSAP